jgi:hypothetical protein
MDGNEQGDFGDAQGTRVGAPDQTRTPAAHSDTPPDRRERQTGTGAEAEEGTSKTGEEHDREHRSGYGGAGGKPVTSSDER